MNAVVVVVLAPSVGAPSQGPTELKQLLVPTCPFSEVIPVSAFGQATANGASELPSLKALLGVRSQAPSLLLL